MKKDGDSMSKKFSQVKYFYDNGVWGKTEVRNAVIKNWITAAEYKQITGEKYEAA